MKNFTITNDQLNKLASKQLIDSWAVITPSNDGSKYSKISSAEELIVDSSLKPTDISIKDHFFCPHYDFTIGMSPDKSINLFKKFLIAIKSLIRYL